MHSTFLRYRQKVTLWQHADELEQEQIAMGVWINEKTVQNCMACDLAFTLLSRKVSTLSSLSLDGDLRMNFISLFTDNL